MNTHTSILTDHTLRIYMILRGDLGMTPGKAAAQAGHAAMEAYRKASPSLQADYHADGLGTKVCLVAPNLESLFRAQQEAECAGLPTALITDSGHMSFFNGEPTVTALGIGPAQQDIKRITRRFKLYD